MTYAATFQSRIEKLMDISTALADLTQSVELAREIPAYLSRALSTEPITLAVVRCDQQAAEVVLVASSKPVAAGESADAFARHILDIHKHSGAGGQTPALRSPFAVTGAASQPAKGSFYEMAVPALTEFPRALVFSHTIDDRHRMCLIFHQPQEDSDAARSAARADDLALISAHLAKLLRCIPAWHDRPEILGPGFQRLTDREWVVLQGLHSEDGEKQLADRLGLSPHTLHSHIKAIYRKVGVQGRLPLLSRMNAAVRDLRKSAMNASPARPETKSFIPATKPEVAVVAVG